MMKPKEIDGSWNKPEEVIYAQREDLKYMQASNVNVSNFVSEKLSGHNNYYFWKKQMLCLIESQRLCHIINSEIPFPEDMGFHMISQYNTLVKGWIFGSMNDKLLDRFGYINSAQDLWERLEFSFKLERDYIDDSLEFSLVNGTITDRSETDDPLKFTSVRLCEAAVEGCWWRAISILKTHKNAATNVISENGNTMLHVAVEMGHNYFVEKLLEFLKDGKDIETKNDKGQTALHVAAVVGNEYAARLLVQKRKQLLEILDKRAKSPFDNAFSNKKLDVSAYLLKASLPSYLLGDGDNNGKDVTSFILAAIYSKQYDLALPFLQNDTARFSFRRWFILKALATTFPCDLGFIESFLYPSFHHVLQKTVLGCALLLHHNILDKFFDDISRARKIFHRADCRWFRNFSNILLVPIATLYPIYQLICLLFLVVRLPFSMLYLFLWKVLAVTVRPIKNISKKRKDYKEAKKILGLVFKYNYNRLENPQLDHYLLPYAVLLDAHHVVDEVLFRLPYLIAQENEDGHNIIQLAIINRSEKVFNLIRHIIERLSEPRTILDPSQNNLVHLVGRLAPPYVLDRTTGAALQLQRELLWREEVEKLLLHIELIDKNLDNETPAMVFTREHKDLLKEGEVWMKTTAESCSITAALIVTIVFAAAITVPGGNKQDSGVPMFKKEAAFTVFAVSNAFSLFTGATALLLFLSILTARFSEKDFLVSLPRRLIFGLLTLFLSTTAMLVAFGAILFLVFCDQRPWMLAPISAFACLPISVLVTIQLPLLVDLIRSTYFPIFGKQSYLEGCKINRRNTIYKR